MSFRKTKWGVAKALLVAACSDDSASPAITSGPSGSAEEVYASEAPITSGPADSSSSSGGGTSSDTSVATGGETGEIAMIPCGGGLVPALAFAPRILIDDELSFESDMEVWNRTLLFVDFGEHSVGAWTSEDVPLISSLALPFETGRIGAGDFDGDSDVDVLVMSEGPGDGRPVLVFEQDQVGTWNDFAQVDVGPAGAMNATFLDLLPAAEGPELVVALRDRARVFSKTSAEDEGFAFLLDFGVEDIDPSGDLLGADVNDDGFLDLVVHGRRIGLGNGRQLVATDDLAPRGGFARGFHLDGSPALAMALLSVSDTLSNREIRFLSGSGDGTFESWRSAEVVATNCYSEPGVGDFNGDGFADLVFPTVCESRERHAARLDFWLGCPDGSQTLVSEAYVDGVQRLGAADFDDDGRTDLALLGPASFSDLSEPAAFATLAVLIATHG
jgi:hypothetical protein